MRDYYRYVVRLLAVVLLSAFVSCARAPQKVVVNGTAQGSFYEITYYDNDARDFQHQFDSIFALIDASVSLWNENSVISKVNRNEEVELDKVFVDNFNIAQEYAALSGGAFDPTVAPLVSMWGFSYKNDIEPTTENIDSLKQLVDYRKVRIEDGKVVKGDERMKLDFNAIAQGYTTDLIAEFLHQQGIDIYLVNVGGEILAHGAKPDGSSWIVGIEKPAENWDSEPVVQERVPLGDMGLVTSGSYRKYVERGGKRYSHTIDPVTGCPVEHRLISATVMAETSVKADALASICMVMGLEKSLELINSLDGVEAFYIYADENGELTTFATEGFKTL